MKFSLPITTSFLFLIIVTSFSGMLFGEQYKESASIDLISAEYNAGNISLGEKSYLNVVNILSPQELPDKYQSPVIHPIKSATPYINEAIANLEMMSEEQKSDLGKLLARPTLDSVYYSPGGYFAIHYSIDSFDSVPIEDLNSNEVPDYVERIGVYADSTIFYYNVHNNYYIPPPDEDGIYDIYLKFLGGGAYGGTVKEIPGDSAWDDYQSHIQINSNLNNVPDNDDPEGKIIGAQKVTVAHEYYHAVQMAYSFRTIEDYWWVEGGATFFENEVYGEVNDNYQYLPYFFDYPDSSLIDYVYLRPYGAFIFSSFLSEKFGVGIIKNIWEYLRYNDVLESIDLALDSYGTDMKELFTEFTVWNYFTGDRAIGGMFYPDAADYPQIDDDNILDAVECPFFEITPVTPPDGLGCNYIIASPNESYPGLLNILFDGFDMVEWSLSFVGFYGDSLEFFYNRETNSIGETNCGIYDYTQYDSILFVPNVVSQWQYDNTYTFTTLPHPFGDTNGNGIINLLDITYLINYIYKNGQDPVFHVLMGDADCDGNINILDVTTIISFLYKEGPAPCQ